MSAANSAPHRRPPLAAILLVPVVVAFVMTLFAWPTARQEPRDLPVGVAGPSAGADVLEERLTRPEGAFDIESHPDEAAARRAIEDREIYGAFVATPTGPKVLIASGASPVVASLLERAARDSRARAEDVIPAGSAAAALGASVLPLVLAGILTGIAAVLLAPGGIVRAALLLAGAALAGLAATAIVQGWLDVVDGGWVANAGALALTVLAIASAVAGLYALMGPPGAALGALTMVLIGNPFSAVGTAPELLPQPVGAIGQLMPPGAGGNLLRSTGYFDGAGAGGHLAVLLTWALAGLALVLAASRSESTS